MTLDKFASMPMDLVGDKKPTSASTAYSYRYICTPLEGGTNYNPNMPANFQLNCGGNILQSELTFLQLTIIPTGINAPVVGNTVTLDGVASMIDNIKIYHNGVQIDELLNYADIYNNYLQWSQSQSQFSTKWDLLNLVTPPEDDYFNALTNTSPENFIQTSNGVTAVTSRTVYIPLIGGIFGLPYLDTRMMRGQLTITINWRTPALTFVSNIAIANLSYQISGLRLFTQYLELDASQYGLLQKLRENGIPKYYSYSWSRNPISLQANQSSLNAIISSC